MQIVGNPDRTAPARVMGMTRQHVDHGDIAAFAESKINLGRDHAKKFRDQVNRLRERLDTYIDENPHFELKKMILSGSLAKGTSLRTINDIDVAVYVAATEAPASILELIQWLTERLRRAFPNFNPEQVQPQKYSVRISFRGTGLDVDIVPILYYGDPDWRGDLIAQDTGEPLMTSIPMHIEFIRRRKRANERHFAQMVRLAKHWVRLRKAEDDGFLFKSFLVELVLARLADDGLDVSDYPEALAAFFNYLARENLAELIVFDDYYDPATVPESDDPVRAFDPVNPENNVGRHYTNLDRDVVVDAALDAGDAIDSALRATTKGETVRFWRKVLGPNFEV